MSYKTIIANGICELIIDIDNQTLCGQVSTKKLSNCKAEICVCDKHYNVIKEKRF